MLNDRRLPYQSKKTTVSVRRTCFIILILLMLAGCGGDNIAPPTSAPQPPTSSNTVVTAVPNAGGVNTFTFQQGSGAERGFWQVYFTAPTGSRDPATYVGGIDQALAAAIGGVQRTLDIAAFEFNNPVLTQAVLQAKQRGVRVRVVTDDEHGIEDEDTTLDQLQAAGITVVNDERSALMHNKFMILDGTTVWTGSWNYTINDTYRNNNNALVLRSRQAVADYQAEFDEMYLDEQFGPRSPADTPNPSFTQDGIPVQIYFAPEDEVIDAILNQINGAQGSIRFMAFSFTHDDLGDALLNRAAAGVDVQGIFETTGSQTQFAELTPLFCAGLPVRQDGNPFILHHKVFIIDAMTVVTGSFNFSANATDSNDENLVIIRDPALAQLYLQEYDRRWAEARTPTGLTC
jgi:phosphatidylserine/phosphatidylglycerophosphate/cardiolipin synthase-like enzyme